MTQLTFEVEASLEARIREAAKEQGIVSVTLYDREPELPWHSWRTRPGTYANAGGASGPHLDDFEAAVLIAAGVEYRVHEYALALQVEGEGRGEDDMKWLN